MRQPLGFHLLSVQPQPEHYAHNDVRQPQVAKYIQSYQTQNYLFCRFLCVFNVCFPSRINTDFIWQHTNLAFLKRDV